ncbi:hypothetical protein D6C81_09719 [Aureobasidium pullulans]|nr:hypothetical protein D6C81_09719 [Aureobasidium pullulans]
MQSSNKESGGLNFVFESGSSGRENKKYVRSHAAKVGWSQRSRNKAVAASKDDKAANQDSTPKKRRKTTHVDPAPGAQSSSQQQTLIYSPVAQPSVNRPTQYHAEAGASRQSRSPSSLATREPPQHHVPSREAQFTAYSASRPPISASRAHSYTSAPCPSSSPLHQPQRHGQQGHVRVQEVETNTSSRAAASSYPSNEGHSSWQSRPAYPQHDTVAQQVVASQFRAAASPLSIQSRQAMPGADILRPVPPISPLPSPRLPSLSNMLTAPPSSLGTSWRQYSTVQDMTASTSQPSTPTLRDSRTHDESNHVAAERALHSPEPSPKKSSTPAFLELVLNEDYPMWKSVDSGSDSFGVFPVKWQPFYGRLLHNYRSNMLVQLDEILTGWTVNEKIEFNSMPLRLAGSEPSLFYALLSNAAIMMPPGLISPAIPRWLQNRTVECMNKAFEDPKRAYSNATILSLNLVALFDSISGNAKLARKTHQPMLRKMVNQRGGLTAMVGKADVDSMNLVRFLAWTDRVIRCQTGNALMFEDFEEDASVTKTNWEDIWARMERRVEENEPEPIEEMPDAE